MDKKITFLRELINSAQNLTSGGKKSKHVLLSLR